MKLQYSTIVSHYSLAAGEVGKPLGNPVVTPFTDGPSALLALEAAMNNPVGTSGLVGGGFLIGLPDGREVPFDAAYAAIFGEEPIRRDNRENLYPRLKSFNPPYRPQETPHPAPHDSKSAALAALAKKPLSCQTWLEGETLMSAIYWNGKLSTQPADLAKKW